MLKSFAKAPPGRTNLEAELLICCSSTHIDSERAERIRDLLQENIDWDYLIQIASNHKLIPLLYQSLHTVCPEAIPKASLDQLRADSYATLRYNLFLTRELLRILNVFENHGIPAIPYKGPTVANIYGNLGLR